MLIKTKTYTISWVYTPLYRLSRWWRHRLLVLLCPDFAGSHLCISNPLLRPFCVSEIACFVMRMENYE